MAEPKENSLEWFQGDDYMTCYFAQRKYITKARKIIGRCPDFDAKLIENQDGSICVRLPLKALKLYVKTSVDACAEHGEEEEDEGGEDE